VSNIVPPRAQNNFVVPPFLLSDQSPGGGGGELFPSSMEKASVEDCGTSPAGHLALLVEKPSYKHCMECVVAGLLPLKIRESLDS
jgi:hypothetical protein